MELVHLSSAGQEELTKVTNTSKSEEPKTVTVPMHVTYDVMYTTPIWIGNPPKQFAALLDTGSSNFWVAGHNVEGKGSFRLPHTYYNPAESNTSKVLNEVGISAYGSGNLVGHFVEDEVRIGYNPYLGDNQKHFIHLKNFKFGVFEKQKGILETFKIDAVVGMAYQSLTLRSMQSKNVTGLVEEIIN